MREFGLNLSALNWITKLFMVGLVVFCVDSSTLAQQGNNPFELTPRLGTTQTSVPNPAVQPSSTNPFDLVAPTKDIPAPQKKADRVVKPKKVISEAGAYRRFLFISLITTLLLFTLLITFLRPFFQKVYSAFSNDTMFHQVLRERESIGLLPFMFLYTLFFFNAGLFLYLLLHYLKIPVASTHLISWLYCIGGVVGAFFLKHLTLNIIGAVFPVQKEIRSYNFLIIVFAVVIGVILVPVNVLLAYGPEYFDPYLFYFASGTLVLTYLFRYLRSLIIVNRFSGFYNFHFLLYICTVEIAPVLFLVKLIQNQI